DATGIDRPVLSPVERFESTGHFIVGNGEDLPAPGRGGGELADALDLRWRLGLADVVNSSRRAVVRRRQDDCVGDVLDVAVSPAPLGELLFEQDRRPVV